MDTTERLTRLFESSLMQSWAPFVHCLNVWDQTTFMLPGLPAFLKAASSLHQLIMTCNSTLEAAQISCLLKVCKVKYLFLNGVSVPGAFSPEMCSLYVNFSSGSHGGPVPLWDPQMPSALVYNLLDQRNLQEIHMDFGVHSNVVLACPVQLPRLHVSLSLALQAHSRFNLSWLEHQSCSISLTVRVMTSDLGAHRLLIQQLIRIPVGLLLMDMRVSASTQVQDVWKQISVDALRISMPASSPSLAYAVQALPACPSVKFYRMTHDSSAVYVNWAALIDQPREISFQLQVLNVVGWSGCLPEFGDLPWQLSIDAGCQVHGLPDMYKTHDGSWLLQNAAAVATYE